MDARFAAAVLTLALANGCGSSGPPVEPSPPPPPSSVTCTGYLAQASSPYVLPYAIGRSFQVGQGNCTTRSHATGSPDEYSYDFLMPIGTSIVASRT